MNKQLSVETTGQGLYEITHMVRQVAEDVALVDGLITLFVRHTSASLLIQENADRKVRDDLQNWLARLVPEVDALYTHTEEGPDDMPAHVKAALTQVSLTIPVSSGRLLLGTWQGVFLWEHRDRPHVRQVVVSTH